MSKEIKSKYIKSEKINNPTLIPFMDHSLVVVKWLA